MQGFKGLIQGFRVLGVRGKEEVPKLGSYVRLIDFVYHSTPGLRVTEKKKGREPNRTKPW